MISSSLNQRGNAWKIQATGLRSHSSMAAMRCWLAWSWGAESFDLSQAAWWGHRRPVFGVGHTKSKCHLCTSGHPPAPLLPRLRRGVGTPPHRGHSDGLVKQKGAMGSPRSKVRAPRCLLAGNSSCNESSGALFNGFHC